MTVSGIASTKHCMLFHFVIRYKLGLKLTSSKGQVLVVLVSPAWKAGSAEKADP